MASATSFGSSEKSAAEYEAIADQLLVEMQRLDERMQQDRVVIKRLKLETACLEAETRAALDRLKAML
jgi:hypothetical protein